MNETTQTQAQQIAAGFYKGRAIAGSEQYGTSENGTETVAVDVDVPALGRHLTVKFYFTDKAMPYALEKLRACGWTGDDVTSLVNIDANEGDVTVKYEAYEGKMQMKVDISTMGGGRIKLDNPMDDAAKRAFAARVRAAARSTGGASAAPSGGRANAPAGVRTAPAARGPSNGGGGRVGPGPNDHDADDGFFDGLP